ncbi:polyphosphate kinase 1 [Bengtsoniella intestinalis]|uniref:polyphosphate kinase 1 n=1 Tax=Bengtsoniella intestinalis TaxID=3073143 RepID=UPI00391FACDB
MEQNLPSYTQNRELSWLKFNQRVLEEAADRTVPLYERLKFVAIYSSNLDEFYMIRVGSLADSILYDPTLIDKRSGMTAQEQLQKIYAQTEVLSRRRDEIYRQIKEEFSHAGVEFTSYKKLSGVEKRQAKTYFNQEVLPLLSPQIIDLTHPLPHIPNKTMNIVLLLEKEGKQYFGLVPIPARAERVLRVTNQRKLLYVERLVYDLVEELFPNCRVLDKATITITRNADIQMDDEVMGQSDYRDRMKQLLKKRNSLAPVKLETMQKVDSTIIRYMQEQLEIIPEQTFRSKTPLDMSFVFKMPSWFTKGQKENFCYSPYEPCQALAVAGQRSMTRLVRHKDVLLHYPYHSMEPFLRLVEEASRDKSVVAIKITIYRLASEAKLVEHLCNAAENGKEVVVIMELRARFDEQNNIDFSNMLEEAGCKIYYGFEDYKIHSKICLITYKQNDSISYITQIGTGNYNEKTAKLYTDFSLMTAHKGIGTDADAFFRNMLVSNLSGSYEHLMVAPHSMKNKIFDQIDGEIQKAIDGQSARVLIKMNSLTEVDTIHKLQEASCAGVEVILIIRGICCLIPDIAGETENIKVVSLVGKYLEHHRVYAFGTGGDLRVYISSADCMTRNLTRRVEIAAPILDMELRKEIMAALDLILKDNLKSRVLRNDGQYVPVVIENTHAIDAQIAFEQQAQAQEKKGQGILRGLMCKFSNRE